MSSLEFQLLSAIQRNDTSAVSLLIEKGVNVNHPALPLSRAARLGRVEIMSLLVDAGAKIDADAHVFNTACYAAVEGGTFDALKLLVDRGAPINCSALLKAAADFAHDDQIILLLLDAGAPLDNLSSVDVMNLIAHTSSVAVLQRLVRRGVDVGALRGHFNHTLCHRVTMCTDSDRDIDDLMRAVVDAGVNVDAADDCDTAPLHVAADKSSVRVLVELGADIDRQDLVGYTALHFACARSLAANIGTRVELVLALGANVHLVNKSGRTASHIAARKQHRANLCACLAAGADLDQPDNEGDTVRMIATRNHFQLSASDEIDNARRRIAKTRLDFVRQRAVQICMVLQSFNLNALELCEIMMYSFGAIGSLIAFHQWWAIATTVKHFHDRPLD